MHMLSRQQHEIRVHAAHVGKIVQKTYQVCNLASERKERDTLKGVT